MAQSEVSDFGSGHDLTVQFVSLSPMLGSMLTARSLEPASDSVSPSLPATLQLMLCLSLSLRNKHYKFFKKRKEKVQKKK